MQVSLEKLTQAMHKVRKFAEGQKNVPGVLFNIGEDKMSICYSDGKKSIIEKIDVEQAEPAFVGQIVVPYVRIMAIIDMCQPSGPVFTSDLDITMQEGNIMVIKALKKIKVGKKVEEAEVSAQQDAFGQLEGEEQAEVEIEEKVVSKFEQKLGYYNPTDSIQYGVLSRMDYESIFEGENVDVWSRDEFKDVLSRTSTEKGKVIYVSSVMKAAFVVNLSHVTNIPISACESNGLTVHTQVADALVEILGKMQGDTVTVCVKESRYANIVSKDNSVGIWFELVQASKSDLTFLQRYQEKVYDKYKMVFCRAALQNVISCAIYADSNEKTALTFGLVENGLMAVKIASGKDSVANEFYVVMEDYKDNIGNLTEVKIPVNLKVLYDMLGNCRENYVAIDIAVDDSGIFIRIGDIIGKENGEDVLGITHYTVSAK